MANFDVTIKAQGEYLQYVACAKSPRAAALVIRARRKERGLVPGTVTAVTPIPECVRPEGKVHRKR